MNDPLATFPVAISSLIHILIIFVLFALISFVYKLLKRMRSTPTSTTPTAPETPPATQTPATPPAQSGWQKYKGLAVPAIVVLVLAGAVWLLYSAGYLNTGYKTATGWIPAKPLQEEELESSCSMPILTQTGFYYKIRFDEGGYSGPGGCVQFFENQVFSLEVIEGNTKYWNGETSSEADANGTVGQSEYKLPGAEKLPLGIVIVGIDSEPVIPLGKAKFYFKVTKTHLEVYDKKDNGTLVKKIPIVLPAVPGGYSSRLGLMGNSQCDKKSADGKNNICTAAFTVRQEYYTK